jgi:hypothetical protein
MSGPLTALERLIERILERPAARLFGTGVEPVQVRHRLERAMDSARRGPDGSVPDRYEVRVHPDDLAGLGDTVPAFAGALVVHARRHGYRLPGRPVVELAADPMVPAGEVLVQASFARVTSVAGGAIGARSGPARAARTLGGLDGPPTAAAEQPPWGATMVFDVPTPRVPYTTLLVQTPLAAPREFVVRAASVRIGRDSDNDLVLLDARVSRWHGLLAARQGGLVYTDLGSTNGSFVNGVRVREVALGPGDVLQLGDSTVTVATAG